MPSAKKIAVAGATGRVGHHAVDVLQARGHAVVPMSRSQGVDVITGDGLAAAWQASSASLTRPRQVVRIREQLSDWQAAITFAADLPEVYPARLAIWGFSLSAYG